MLLDKNGKFVKSSNSAYSTTEGYFTVTEDNTCPYENTIWTNFVLYIPNTILNSLNGVYSANLWLYINQKWYECPYKPIISNVSSSSNNNKASSSTSSSRNTKHLVDCWNCNGSGKIRCAICNGNYRGPHREPAPFYPYYTLYFGDCKYCNQGYIKCGRCKGSGKIDLSETSSTSSSHTYSDYTKPAKKEYERRVVTCKYCNGTGLEKDLSTDGLCIIASEKCKQIYCNKCGDTHCHHLHHINCSWCEGTGQVKQIKIDGKWERIPGGYD